MPITVYSDVILRNGVLSSGVHGKNRRATSRLMTEGGAETVVSLWSQALREYELATVPRTIDQWREIEALHEITAAGAFGFLLEDPKDRTVASGQGKASLVSGSTYQLKKRYTFQGSSQYHDRVITRPKSTGLAVTYNGSTIGGWTLDATTGRITFGSPVADPTLLGWSGDFYVPVHFTQDEIDWELIAPGGYDSRYIAAPTIPLAEIRE